MTVVTDAAKKMTASQCQIRMRAGFVWLNKMGAVLLIVLGVVIVAEDYDECLILNFIEKSD